MADVSVPSQEADLRRRQDILRRTRMGLQEDLDDLRDELIEVLEDFESRLRRTALHLPRWLDLPDKALRTSFELRYPDSMKGVLIGPRAVAMVASDVEDFLQIWLGDAEGAIPAWEERENEESIQRLQADISALETIIAQTIDSVSVLADEGPFELEQLLESIVFELENRREVDVEALKSMIHDGDVDAGRDAQAEIAELWEEQRRRVNQLQRVWDDILALHHEGVTRSLRGLNELKEIAQRTRQGIEGAAILEASNPEGSSFPTIPHAGPGGSSSTAEANPFIRSSSQASEPNEEPTSTKTLPSSRPGPIQTELPILGDAGPTAPMRLDSPGAKELRRSDEPEEASLATDLEALAESHCDDPGPTLPETLSETLPDSSPHPELLSSDESEENFPEEEETWTAPDHWSESTLDDEDFHNPEFIDDLPETSPGQADFPEDRSPALAFGEEPEEPEAPEEPEEELLRVRTYRIREGWQIVTFGDVIAALGPPGLYVAIFFLLSLLSLFEITENPMVRWAWAFPSTLAALGLILIWPLLLRWRPMWRGTRFTILRRGEMEDEVDLRLTSSRLYFDRTSWRLDELEKTEVSRWEEKDEEICGWLLTLNPPYQTPISIATFVDLDHPKWAKERTPLKEAPDDAWQVPAEEFHRLAEALRG